MDSMKLPGGEGAIVEIAKIREYCLSATHARGKHKARVFHAALGLRADHAEELQLALATLRSEDLIRLHHRPLEQVA